MEKADLPKVLMIRLNPLLGLLSATIERYVELEEEGENQDRNHEMIFHGGADEQHQSSPEEKMIGLLKSQVQLLDALGSELNYRISRPDWCVALGHIAPFVILPLIAILKSYNRPALHLSRQSQLWKSQQGAATVLMQVLSLCPPNTISSEQKRHLLLVCVMALNANKNLDTMELEMTTSKRLDRGEEHDKALLRCLQALLHENAGIEGGEIGTMLDGNLLASLVARCIDIVSPPPHMNNDLNLQDTELVIEALITLSILLNRVSDKVQWRALFPGCFAALIRRSLARSKAGRITASSVERLTQLLCVTLGPVVDTNASMDVMLQLAKLTRKGNATEEAVDDPFIKECHNRLPKPLTALIIMSTSSTSTEVRISVLVLCRALLMETSIWNDSNLETQALECCIILRNDTDNDVRIIANEVLGAFKTCDHWNDSEFVFTALDIMSDLPILARSQRHTELCSKVRIAQGYLELCIDTDSSRIGHLLTAQEEQFTLRHSLSSIFDMDFESLQQGPKVFLLTSQFASSNGTSPVKFRFLRNDAEASAKTLVKTLGWVLGPKNGCLFVDACIADLHESCVLQVERGLAGRSHVSWLHEWIGIAVVAEHVLVGLLDNNYGTVKEKRRTSRRVKALAAALFPLLLVDSPLWISPNIHEAADPGTHKTTDFSVSAEAHRGNAAMLCSLLTFVGALINALDADLALSWQVLLFALFERCSIHNHSRVQAAAAQGVIGAIAKAMLASFLLEVSRCIFMSTSRCDM